MGIIFPWICTSQRITVIKSEKSRLPGVVYLITVLTGLFSLMYVPKQLIDLENISDTIASIEANRLLFAYGIIGELLCYIAFLILPLVLYPYLKNDCHHLANIMVGLVLVAAPISCLAVVDKIDILGFLDDPDMQAEKLEMLITLSYKSYYSAIRVASIFWGLWLIPFGYLGYTSGRITKILCVFLIVGGIGYQINFIGPLLTPEFSESVIRKVAKIPSTIGEIGTCFWLLFVGIRRTDNDLSDS